MIAFRKRHPELRHSAFLTDRDIDWHDSQSKKPNWEEQDSFLAFTLKGPNKAIFVAFNAQEQSKEVMLPPSPIKTNWHWVVNTAKPSPQDFNEHPDQFPVTSIHTKCRSILRLF